MINPKVENHPYYDLTDKMRKDSPNGCERWGKLLREVKDSKNRGCYTCQFYAPINSGGGNLGFCDIEFDDKDDEQHPLPWDTEEAWVLCDKFPEEQTSLKIGCSLWETYKPKNPTLKKS